MPNPVGKRRVVILGAGFGGTYTALHLQHLWRNDPSIEVTLINRDNYFLMTPLLFEASSGVLEPRHSVTPIRLLLTSARFVEAEIERIDLDHRLVFARLSPADEVYQLPFDHLVLALGGVTNRRNIPGSESALTFKSLADAIYLRNHVIDLFERADVEKDPSLARELLTFVVVGAGLVGVELIGELSTFVHDLASHYPHVQYHAMRLEIVEHGPLFLPEMDRELADYAARVLARRGVRIRTNTPVTAIDPRAVHLAGGERIPAATIILTTGVMPNPLLSDLPLEKDRAGRLVVEPTMRCVQRPDVWALGDCAAIPEPTGKTYPPLAQHALREARTLAGNITASLRGHPEQIQPFVYETLGTLASLGGFNGVGRIRRLHIRGFLAWWVWRTYYLLQMPRWSRRIRIVLDWTVALFFKPDIVKLDLFGTQHPQHPSTPPLVPSPPLSQGDRT